MKVLFWTLFWIVVYVYAIYPALVLVLARCFGRSMSAPADLSPDAWPSVSLLIAAHNEAVVLAARLDNALALDYPPDRLEIVVGSDGSTDESAEVVRGFEDRGVRLIDFPSQRGKAAVLDAAIPGLQGSVLILTDANTVIDTAAVRRLVRWFVRPEVTAVCGRLLLTDPATGKNVDGIYWKYETFLKNQEAQLGALLGANGAIYAIRRDRYVPIPDGTIIEDFVIPLLAKLRHGGTILFEPAAIAREETAADVAAEFRRRTRIGAGGFQALGLLWPLLDPRHGWTSFAFLSHKVLRWFCPFCLIGLLVVNLMLVASPGWKWVLATQIAFYAISLVVAYLPPQRFRIFRLATMFTSMNLALLIGFWNYASGRQRGTWTPTERTDASLVESGR